MNDQFTELVSYIGRHVQQGVSVEHIRTTLLQHNWHEDVVDRAIWTALAPQSVPQEAAPQPTPVQPLVAQQPVQQQIRPQATAQLEQPALHPAGDSQQRPPVVSDRPPKYTVRRAIKDFFVAARSNFKTFLLATIISCIVAELSAYLLAILAITLPWQGGSTTGLVITVTTVFIGLSAWYAATTAFIMASTSLPLYDNGLQKHESLKDVLVTAFKRAKRIILANLFMLSVAVWPLVVVIVAPLLYFFNSSDDGMIMLALMPILSILAIIWTAVAFVLFALVPYVAIFEPSMPIRQMLRRSQHLLSLGGYWFVAKGVLLSIILYIITAVLSGGSLADTSTSSTNIAVNLLGALLAVVANGVMVMLYRNRKTVRG